MRTKMHGILHLTYRNQRNQYGINYIAIFFTAINFGTSFLFLLIFHIYQHRHYQVHSSNIITIQTLTCSFPHIVPRLEMYAICKCVQSLHVKSVYEDRNFTVASFYPKPLHLEPQSCCEMLLKYLLIAISYKYEIYWLCSAVISKCNFKVTWTIQNILR